MEILNKSNNLLRIRFILHFKNGGYATIGGEDLASITIVGMKWNGQRTGIYMDVWTDERSGASLKLFKIALEVLTKNVSQSQKKK